MTSHAGFDIQALAKHHDDYLWLQLRVVEAALQEIVDVAITTARETTRVKVRSGAMMRGWARTPVMLTSMGLLIQFINPVPHALYHEVGTGIYGYKKTPIVPKRSPYLHFRTADGHWVRTKSVKGVPPKYIGSQSFTRAAAGPEPVRIITRHLERISTRF